MLFVAKKLLKAAKAAKVENWTFEKIARRAEEPKKNLSVFLFPLLTKCSVLCDATGERPWARSASL